MRERPARERGAGENRAVLTTSSDMQVGDIVRMEDGPHVGQVFKVVGKTGHGYLLTPYHQNPSHRFPQSDLIGLAERDQTRLS